MTGFSEDERSHIHELHNKIINDLRKHSIPDTKLLNSALSFAMEKHGEVRRKTGEPYIEHPLAVAQIVVDLGFESDVVAAAILHDVEEDCGVTVEELEKNSGAP